MDLLIILSFFRFTYLISLLRIEINTDNWCEITRSGAVESHICCLPRV